MFRFNFFAVLQFLFLVVLPVFSASLADNAADAIVHVTGTMMSATAISSGETRIYYRNSTTGGIAEVSVSNAFNIGRFESSIPLVPVAEVRSTTPIAVVSIGDPWSEIHLFFMSPTNVLSEYIWTATTNTWQGGASCSTCLTADHFVAATSSNMMYALVSTASSGARTWRVGFVSAGVTNTISEVVNNGNGWTLAPLSS